MVTASRVGHAVRARLEQAHPPPRLPFVTTFDAVPSATTVDVDLPCVRAPRPRTQTEGHPFPPVLVDVCQHAPYPLRAAVIPDGRLSGASGAVVTPDGHLVLESLWDYEHWARSFDRPQALPEPTRLRGRYASLVTLWGHGFYHWMFEALPRLAVLRASGLSFDGIIVPDPVTRFMRESLVLAGIDEALIVPFTGSHLQVDELVWCAPLAPVSYPTPYSVAWLRSTLGAPDVTPTRRVYLPRAVRGVSNEKHVAGIFRDADFEVVEPDQLDLRGQVELWSQIRHAAGPHGAVFSGSIFSKDVTALELYQREHVNVSFPAVLAASGGQHWTLIGRRVPALNGARHHEVHVPPRRLRATLQAMALT
jgi:capsular polysaccharide biosynthesis protein